MSNTMGYVNEALEQANDAQRMLEQLEAELQDSDLSDEQRDLLSGIYSSVDAAIDAAANAEDALADSQNTVQAALDELTEAVDEL